MTRLSWYGRAQAVIMEVDRNLPRWADEYEVKRALRRAAWRAHEDTSWGRKQWRKAVKRYLQQKGYAPSYRVQMPVSDLPLFAGGRA